MRKLLLLLFTLLTSFSSAWAETVTVTSESALWSTTGTLGYNGSENWAVSWTSSNEKVKITCPANGHINKNSSQMGTNTFTIWTPGTEMITGFTLTFTSCEASNCTVTSGLVSKTSTGTSNEQILSISGIFAHFVQITVSGKFANVSAFSIDYTSMPAQSATGYYLIKGNWPTNNYLYANSSNATKLWKKWPITDESSLYFDANYVWQIDEYGDYRSLYNVGASRYVSNFTTANSSSTSKSGADVNLLNATEFSDAELFVLTNDLSGNSLTGAKAYKACSKSSNCYLDNYSEANDYTGFHSAAHKGNAFLPTRVYKVTFKAANESGSEVDGKVLVNGNLTNVIYVPASTTLSSITGSKYFIGGVEKTESEVKTAVNAVTDDNLVVYVTPLPTTITLNFKEGETLVATKTISAKSGVVYDILSNFGFQSRYMTVAPSTVTGTSSDQNIDVTTSFTLPFTVCSNPATDETRSRVYYLTLHDKHAHGNSLSASLNREDKDYFWTFGGDYINGFTIYNKGQESYMSNGLTNGSTSTFGGSSTRYILYSNTDNGFYLKVKDSDNNYLNDVAGALSTWTCNGYDLPTYVSGNVNYYAGCFIKIEDVESDLSDLYTYVNGNYGSALGKYHVSVYTSSDVSTAISTAATAYSEGDVYEAAAAAQTLSDIKEDMSLNIPTNPIFFRIRSSQGDKGYMTAAVADGRATFTSATDKTTIYLWASDGKLVAYGNGLAYNMMYVPKANVADAVSYNIIPAVSGNVGQYSITCQNDKSETIYLYSTGSGNADRNTVSTNADWKQRNSFTLEPVTSLPVTIGSSGYATLYSPVALEVPSDVTAFWGENSEEDDAILVHAIKTGEVIPANNGVVLYTETGNTTYNFNITTGGSISGTNVILGTVATKARDGEYTLQIPSAGGTPAFFGNGPANLQGFKAYLPSGSSYVMQLIFDEETVVKAIEAAMNPGKVVYDMNGRRVENPSKGLYIVNGKKVIIK